MGRIVIAMSGYGRFWKDETVQRVRGLGEQVSPTPGGPTGHGFLILLFARRMLAGTFSA